MISILDQETPIYKSKNSVIYHKATSDYDVPVVVKMFPSDVPSVQQLSYFKNEYEITKDINVGGIRKVLEQTEIEGKAALVMEYIKGKSLAGMLNNQNKLPIETFLPIAISVSQILGEIHQHHIIHRDINNNNILVDADSLKVTIIDFGISSKIDTRMPHLGNPDVLEGTLAYISPEQTGRMNRVVDYRTDLYSLGISFYAALTGQLPFVGDNSMELVHAHLAKIPEPPSLFNHEIPQVLSDIVMRLLAKNAENRYQSAFGLKHDLKECFDRWQRNQSIDNFELGQQDYSGKFRLVEKLYGRENDMQILLAAFDRVAQGNKELMLVAGYSGIGKSALVNEIHKPITQKYGHFIKGKYDQFQRNIPYSAIGVAFNKFCNYLLTLRETDLGVWRRLIQKTVGVNGKVLTEVIPSLELVIGKQPDIARVAPQEAQNRFNSVMQNFVKIISTKEHPLVVFLDDLQWADAASLSLLKLLMTDEENHYFMIIGAYRDNEVTTSHPFMITVEELRKTEAKITEITLQNLTKDAVSELIKDAINCQTNQNVVELSELVYEKTLGNAFFTTQLLKNIYEEELLSFDFSENKWVWDVREIHKQQITDNVVNLMTQKIEKLPNETQKVLKLAACVGNQFDLQTLAIIGQTDEHTCITNLWPAVVAGLIAPLDDHYQLYKHRIEVNTGSQETKAYFKFIHDRVQQAAYSAIAEKKRQEVHLQAGHLLLENTNKESLDERIFDIVNHLNLGKELIVDESEQLLLAKLNLQAGKQAKQSTAYASAIGYFKEGIAFLGDQLWTTHYELAFELYKQQGETMFLTGDFANSDELLGLALEKARSRFDKADIYLIKIAQLSGQVKYAEAVAMASEALDMFDIFIPDPGQKEQIDEAIQTEIGRYIQNMQNRTIEDLMNLPLTEDQTMKVCSSIMGIAMDSVFLGTPALLALYTSKMVNMSIAYGLSEFSPIGYAFMPVVQVVMQDYRSAYEFADVALKLNTGKVPNQQIRAKVIFMNAWYTMLKSQIRVTAESFKKAYQQGYETGDFVYAGYSFATAARYFTPMSLHESLHEGEMATAYGRKSNNVPIMLVAHVTTQYAKCLQGNTIAMAVFDDDDFQESAYIAAFDQVAPALLAVYKRFKLAALNYFGLYDQALALVHERATWLQAFGAMDLSLASDYYLHTGVVVAALYAKASKEEQAQYDEILDECMVGIDLLSEQCKSNFAYAGFLLNAEKARIGTRNWEATGMYEKAINAAARNGYPGNAALASELFAKFWLSNDQETFATLYMQKAAEYYNIWGAGAKALLLEEQYPKIFSQTYQSKVSTSTTTILKTSATSLGKSSRLLDLDSILKSSQALSQEVKVDDLIEKMLHIVIENTGAEKGYLIESNAQGLLVKAKGGTASAQVMENPQVLDESTDLPVSLINYVARSHKETVLDNASKDERYTNDAYIQVAQPKSVLCYPLFRQNQLNLLFYLENNLVVGAFTAERLEVLHTLSSQMAISMENALLYENLEQKVEERTEELNRALGKIMDSIQYAQRIQNAMLISEDQLSENFADHFTLYLPKDVVSGDFYWINRSGESVVLAVVDCTGHGVPGAFMSMIGNALLNEIVNEQKTYAPSKILGLLHDGVNKALKQSETENNDGMDVCLCWLDCSGNNIELTYSGAKRPLFYKTKGKLGRLDGTRLSIGGWRGGASHNFVEHSIQLYKGDTLYLSTDGYVDAPNNKRRSFTRKRFTALLDEISDLPLAVQKEELLATLRTYQEGASQRDDITILGVKL